MRLAEGYDRRQILSDAVAIQTFLEVRIESELIALADLAID
jgi:hypothetical protein